MRKDTLILITLFLLGIGWKAYAQVSYMLPELDETSTIHQEVAYKTIPYRALKEVEVTQEYKCNGTIQFKTETTDCQDNNGTIIHFDKKTVLGTINERIYYNISVLQAYTIYKQQPQLTSRFNLTINNKEYVIDYSSFGKCSMNPDNKSFICDSKQDGNADGICQMDKGESCVLCYITITGYECQQKNSKATFSKTDTSFTLNKQVPKLNVVEI